MDRRTIPHEPAPEADATAGRDAGVIGANLDLDTVLLTLVVPALVAVRAGRSKAA